MSRNTNYYYCSQCKKYTKHIELTAREWDSELGRSKFERTMSAIFVDGLGLTKLCGEVLDWGKFYKCCECGEHSLRTLDGECKPFY